MTIDLLKEMPRITREIGLEPSDLPQHSTLCLAFERLEMRICRVLLGQSAQLHDTGDIAAIDATYFDRSPASRHYCRRTNYRVQTLEASKLVDTETKVILDLYCTTTWGGSDRRATEVILADHASILRRTLSVWGCPVGGRGEVQSPPELIEHLGEAGRGAFLAAYVSHRAVTYDDKATSRLQGEQPESFHRAIAELIAAATGEATSYDARGVTVSAAAMRALGFADPA